ncbi:MAG: hypothetical protein KGS46_13620 [Chloroflexi bacterium]|nr:hypothetical protein [Chloroflexota bacterium]
MAVYDKNGVFIDHGRNFVFGGLIVKTTESNTGGDTLIPGLHAVLVKSAGMFSSESYVVLSYYYPDGAPDKTVWKGKTSDAEEIADAIRTVTKCY